MCAEKLKNRAHHVFVTAKLADIPKKNAASNLIFSPQKQGGHNSLHFVAFCRLSNNSFIKQYRPQGSEVWAICVRVALPAQ